MALPGFTDASQQKLAEAKVLIVGAGGLGCPATQYLTTMGVGTIGIADADVVSVSNLHRQILYTPADEGKKKVQVAAKRLQEQNPDIHIISHELFVSTDNVMSLVSEYDIVLDCTDNFETRYLLNDACVLAGKPLVYGAIYQYEGQVAVWNVADENDNRSPNYRDLFPNVNASAVPNCAEGGVIPTIAGIIGCMQANEAVKYITKLEGLLAGKLLIMDARTMQSRMMKLGITTKTNITSLPESILINEIEYAVMRANIDEYELIDVRSVDERNTFNIGGTHIPLKDLTENALINTTKPVVFYCATGKRSKAAAKQMQETLSEKLFYSLKGGLSAIQQEH